MSVVDREARFTEREMYLAIRDRVIERRQKYHTIIVDRWPMLCELGEDTILGDFSWLGTKTRTRRIFRPTMMDIDGNPATCGDIARDYLAVKFDRERRIIRAQADEVMLSRPHPLHFEVKHIKRAVYVDIRSTYMSLMSVVGWNVDYWPRKWLSPGEGMNDFPFRHHKRTRNVLATAGLKGSVTKWIEADQRITVEYLPNRWINYQLWALMHDVLAGIAHELLPLVSYIHTDGCICDEANYDAVLSIYQSWGLPTSIKKHGECFIYASNGYSFTAHDWDDVPHPRKPLTAIYELDYADWLKRSFTKFVKFACPTLPNEELLCSTC